MTSTTAPQLLRTFEPFDRLPEAIGGLIDPLLEPCRFRLGQAVLLPDVLPSGVLLIRSGQLRSLAPAPRGSGLRTITCSGAGTCTQGECREEVALEEVGDDGEPAARRGVFLHHPEAHLWCRQHRSHRRGTDAVGQREDDKRPWAKVAQQDDRKPHADAPGP